MSVTAFYRELDVELLDRGLGEAPVRCFANPDAHRRDDRNPSCSVNLETGKWKCHGCGMAGNPYMAAQMLGRDARVAADLAKKYGLFIESRVEKPRLPHARQLKAWRAALLRNERLMSRLFELKGWTPKAIAFLGLGFDGERITFPILNQKEQKVGVVRYLPNGGRQKSKAMPGSRRDLFPPPEWCLRAKPVFVVEGEPDAVSVHSAGLQAVAVPGAQAWKHDWAWRFSKWQGNAGVVVLMDCDQVGRELAQRVQVSVPHARIVDLDASRSDGYDIGDVVADAASNGGLWQARMLLESLENGAA